MATLETKFLDFKLENPFLLASAPPTKDYDAIKKAFDAGWAGVVTKSIGMEPYTDVMPRIVHIREGGRLIASQNIEMGTIYSIDDWVGIIDRLKTEYPGKLVYASVIAAAEADHWKSMCGKLAKCKADGIELNLSCPHLGHKGEGMVVGEDPELAGKIVKWVRDEVGPTVKLMPKLTYAAGLKISNVAQACVENGADALAAVNTIVGLCELDISTLTPKLAVAGKTAYGGVSASAIRPFGRFAVAEISKAVDYKKVAVSATGGISDLQSSVEYLALGAGTLQVCSAVMNRGYRKGYDIVKKLKSELLDYMEEHGFKTLDDLVGKALPSVVLYTDLDGTPGKAAIDATGKCTGCALCENACMYEAITADVKNKTVTIDPSKCDGCGSCVSICKTCYLKMVRANQ